MAKGKATAGQSRAVPYPAPKTERCQQLMLQVIQGLGRFPSNDDEIEDRVLACMLVAWGELAAMQDGHRRDEVAGSLGAMGQRVVAKAVALSAEMGARAETEGQSLAEMLYEAVDEGTADELTLPSRPRSSS